MLNLKSQDKDFIYNKQLSFYTQLQHIVLKKNKSEHAQFSEVEN